MYTLVVKGDFKTYDGQAKFFAAVAKQTKSEASATYDGTNSVAVFKWTHSDYSYDSFKPVILNLWGQFVANPIFTRYTVEAVTPSNPFQ